VPLSVHYRLCLVTVRVKVLQNGRVVRFSKRTDCWRAFSCSICNQTATLLGVSRAAVPKVMATHTDRGKMPSAERNSGRKLELSERDRRTLQRIVSESERTAAAKMTVELDTFLKDSVSTKSVRQELHRSNNHGRAAIAKPPVTVSNTKLRKR
jgi:hypothetical protein